ncbi:hypothetical protein [Roseibacillus persicicus]|uniref:hypothetical protein n=1 Tax=Roseibacillus persicicus TaxID=454148 RepID=UPI001674008B|nr:hypothetical protein [Roseibacillus persicicus]
MAFIELKSGLKDFPLYHSAALALGQNLTDAIPAVSSGIFQVIQAEGISSILQVRFDFSKTPLNLRQSHPRVGNQKGLHM